MATQPNYLADDQEDEDIEDDDGGGPADAGTDPYNNQQVGQFQFANGPGAPMEYVQNPAIDGNPPVTNTLQFGHGTAPAGQHWEDGYGWKWDAPPSTAGTGVPQPVSAAAPTPSPAPPAPHLNVLQRMAKLATQHPGATTPTPSTGDIPDYPDALKGLAKIYDQYPQRKAPNVLERIAAGALGAAAGYSNAARRAAPIDIQKTTEGVLYPGYDGQLAAWQSRVIPAQQAVTMATEQVAAQRAGQLNTANVGLKQAQTQMNLDRGAFYTGAGRDSVQVTPAMETITGGVLKAGTTVNKTTVDTAMNDAIKANPSNALSQKVQQLKKLFPNKSDEEIWQAVINPTSVGKPVPAVPEAQIKDNQIKADFASALGKDPATVTDAEMNTARRMFGTGDPLIGASMRAFIAQKHRLPNPAEERQIVSGAVSQRANAKVPPGEDNGLAAAPAMTGPQSGATKMVNGVPYKFDGTNWKKQAVTQ